MRINQRVLNVPAGIEELFMSAKEIPIEEIALQIVLSVGIIVIAAKYLGLLAKKISYLCRNQSVYRIYVGNRRYFDYVFCRVGD